MPRITKLSLDRDMKKIARRVVRKLPSEVFAACSHYGAARLEYALLSRAISFVCGDGDENPVALHGEEAEHYFDRYAWTVVSQWHLVRYSWGEIRKYCDRQNIELPFKKPVQMMAAILIRDSELLMLTTPRSKNAQYIRATSTIKSFNSGKLKRITHLERDAQRNEWADLLYRVAGWSSKPTVKDRLADHLRYEALFMELLQEISARNNKKQQVKLNAKINSSKTLKGLRRKG